MKLQTNFKFIIIILALAACTHYREKVKKIESEILETPVATQLDVIETARNSIKQSSNLTAEQKIKLLDIEKVATTDTTALREEINKMRIVLIKAAFEPSYKAKEVEIIKNKILKLEQRKIKVGLNAFIEARNVIDPSQIEQNAILNKRFINKFNPPY